MSGSADVAVGLEFIYTVKRGLGTFKLNRAAAEKQRNEGAHKNNIP